MRTLAARSEDETVVYVRRQRPDEPTDEIRLDEEIEIDIDTSAFYGLEMFESF